MQKMSWDDLRFVLALFRFESVAEAARRLEVDEATVTRRIARTERLLDVQLFERVRGKVLPTDAGRTAAERAMQVEREVDALVAGTSGGNRSAIGRVRITSVPMLVNRVLIPALPKLLADYPGLHVDLISEPRDLSLTKREADIAVRLARPRRELRTLARRIGYLDYAVFGIDGPDGSPSRSEATAVRNRQCGSMMPRRLSGPSVRGLANLCFRSRSAAACPD
jgi:DNA-binding transcriptional LysR family regulator